MPTLDKLISSKTDMWPAFNEDVWTYASEF